MLGPPGADTLRLARCVATVLPEKILAEAIETARVHSVAGLTGDRTAFDTTRPCRVLHHTIPDVWLVSGGQVGWPPSEGE